ncbi:hypothetical protein ACFFYR_21425 [Paraburkholderia dipogonis]|uniref:hypothetical protein n=1 Tax=Paraburkholderia dipogonis TaxID=1211383 RepID=UPI0035EEF754
MKFNAHRLRRKPALPVLETLREQIAEDEQRVGAVLFTKFRSGLQRWRPVASAGVNVLAMYELPRANSIM